MPLGDIAGEVLGGILRFVAQIIVEFVLEILVKGPGYLIGRLFRKDLDPDGPIVVVVGLGFWIIVLVSIFGTYAHFASAGA